MRFLKKALIVTASILVFYFSAISLISIYYKKEIENRVVSEINKNLVKPIKINHISISAFTNFPFISFSLNEVLLPKSDTSQVPLLKLEKLKILFSPYSILVKKFKVNEILIENGFLDARVDSLGNRDFDVILKKKDTTVTDSKAITSFDIHKIQFHNIHVFYENKFKPKRIQMLFSDTETELSLDSKILTGELLGQLYSKEITLKPGTLFKESDVKVDFKFTFNFNTKVFAFKDCVIMSGDNSYLGNGNIDFKNNSFLTLNVKTHDADIQNVFSLISERWTVKLKPLNLSGKISSDATIRVSLLPGNQPVFSIDFSTDSLEIKNKKINAQIHHLRFHGNLNSNNKTEIESYSISLNDFSARINKGDSVIAKKIVLQNFKDPILKTNALFTLSGNTLFDLINFKDYSDIAGNIGINLTYDGKLNYLFGIKSEAPEMYGDINLNHLKLKLNKVHFGFDDINGRVDFRGDSVRMHQLVVKSGKTDMELNGTAYHLFNSIFNDTTGLEMNINFNSTNFHFSDFNSNSPKSKSTASKRKINVVQNNSFVLPYDLKAKLKGKVKNFYARNYHGNNIELDINLNRKKVSIVESMNSFGGQLSFISNFVPVKNTIYCSTDIHMQKFQIDKVFAAFNNFKQNMLNSNNVKGIVSGDIRSFFVMSSGLVVDTSSLRVDGDFSINKFELIEVEPLMILSKVGFDEKDLKRVTFEKINSSIIFKDNVLEIPRTLFV
ncbi:MAG TPA: AsmA family protein, partial [Cytophaga sp.]|nr:AsmA family protein [Cytophaga sp.]